MKLPIPLFKKLWSYQTGGIILAVLNLLLLVFTGSPWRITSGFLYWGAWVLEKLGFNPATWYYFSAYGNKLSPTETFLNNSFTVINIAVIAGVLLITLWNSEFKWKKIKSVKQFAFALGGGIIMGYGTRLSFGCNIGAFFSAIPSFSLHGWVYGIFMFAGAWIGNKILTKYIL